jgi:hypothetical protein
MNELHGVGICDIWWEGHGGRWKRPKKIIDSMKGVETNIMGVNNVNVSICEI